MGSEIKNKCFVVAMCLENQPRWRRLQTINKPVITQWQNAQFMTIIFDDI